MIGRTAFLTTLLLSTGALAQPAPCETAACYSERGVDARRRGDDATAVELFRRSLELSLSAQTRAQLALAEQAAGRWVDAEANLAEALAEPDRWVMRHRGVLEDSLEAIRERLGRIVVEVDVVGAQLRVDGGEPRALPLDEPMVVEAGAVVVQVFAEGYVAAQRTVEVAPRQLSRVSVSLAPVLDRQSAPAPPRSGESSAVDAVSTPASASEREEDSAGWVWPVAIGLGAAGLLTLGAAVAAAIVRESAVLTWNDDSVCPYEGALGKLSRCSDVYAEWTSARDWMTGLFIAGGALVATASALLLVGGLELGSGNGAHVILRPGWGGVRASW